MSVTDGYLNGRYIGKTCHEVIFDALIDQQKMNRSGDLVGTALAVVERLVEWGYPLRYNYDSDEHRAARSHTE